MSEGLSEMAFAERRDGELAQRIVACSVCVSVCARARARRPSSVCVYIHAVGPGGSPLPPTERARGGLAAAADRELAAVCSMCVAHTNKWKNNNRKKKKE